MNYTKDGVTKEVTCLGFFRDSGWATRDYCECWDENTGHFSARVKDLSLNEKSVVDIVLAGKEFEEIGNVISAVMNNEKGE
jgi:hypothetical protein